MKIENKDKSNFVFNEDNVLIDIQGDLEDTYIRKIENEYLYPIYLDIREKYIAEHFQPICKEEFLNQRSVELINNPGNAIKEFEKGIKEIQNDPEIKPIKPLFKLFKIINKLLPNNGGLSEQFKLLFSFTTFNEPYYIEYFASTDINSHYGFYIKQCENKVKPDYYKQLLLGKEEFDTNIGKFTCKSYLNGNELIMKRAYNPEDYEEIELNSIHEYIKIKGENNGKGIKLPHQLFIIYQILVEEKCLKTNMLSKCFKKLEKKEINITNKLSELRYKLRDIGVSNRFIPTKEKDLNIDLHFIPHIKYCEKIE